MKKIIGIALAAVCLLGCKKELHDQLLRQQLTAIIASLNDADDSAAKKAKDDIDAIISVNSSKMSEQQKQKLSSISVNLSIVNADIAQRKLEMALHPDSEPKPIQSVRDVKKEIGDVATTF
jgi:type III secretory pathway lipoprotein EscJ